MEIMRELIIIYLFVGCVYCLPVVDKGVFVITGVPTCGTSTGYCILGGDCTVDKEFVPDVEGHCDGLRKAFTPRAYFVCCKLVAQSLDNITMATTAAPMTINTTTPHSNSSSISIETSNEANSEEINKSVTSSEEEPSSDEEIITMTTTPAAENSALSDDVAVTTEKGEEAAVTDIVPMTTTTATTTTTEKFIEPETITEKSTSTHTHYSSCLDNNNKFLMRSDRLAAKTTPPAHDHPHPHPHHHQSICWTGAITRTPTTNNKTFNNPNFFTDPGTFLCSGALITPTILITTATCVSRLFGQDLKQFKVVLGSRRLIHPSVGWSESGWYRDVEELVIHEEYGVYSSGSGGSGGGGGGGVVRVNDVAIVKLSPPSANESFCTVCLPMKNADYSGEDCVVSGFSHPISSSGSSAGAPVVVGAPYSSDLHEAEQIIESPNICSAALASYSNNNKNVQQKKRSDFDSEALVCASGRVGAEACFSPRDAGSPLACPSNSTSSPTTGYRLIGLFSSGFHCGTKQMPVLYTNLASEGLREWVGRFL